MVGMERAGGRKDGRKGGRARLPLGVRQSRLIIMVLKTEVPGVRTQERTPDVPPRAGVSSAGVRPFQGDPRTVFRAMVQSLSSEGAIRPTK